MEAEVSLSGEYDEGEGVGGGGGEEVGGGGEERIDEGDR
jgi:hypothetical protein